jgi:hypothetical protein
MAIETVEMRMARLERGCERINERLGLIEHRLTALEPRLASSVTSLRYEMLSAVDTLRSEVRAGDAGLRRQVTAQFYWLLAIVVGSVLVPLLRDLAR